MTKRILVLFAAVCLLLTVTVACGQKKPKVITQDEAFAIIMEDIGKDAVISGDPHVHVGEYQQQVCYDFYLTVDGKSVSYVISTSGEILHKGNDSHSH